MRAIFIFISILAGGCAADNSAAIKITTAIAENFTSCLSATPQGRKSQCAIDFYNNIQKTPINDYGKGPALRYATSLYILFVKRDKNQIDHAGEQGEWMKIHNVFVSELEAGRRKNETENIELANYRQQMFYNAAQLLNPPRNGISCVSQKQGYLTVTNCN